MERYTLTCFNLGKITHTYVVDVGRAEGGIDRSENPWVISDLAHGRSLMNLPDFLKPLL